jgi:hypothetical protein
MMSRVRWLLVTLVAVASLTGPQACKGGAQCLRHTDCTREEVCDLGTCVIKSTPDSGLADAGSSASGGGASTGGRASATGGKAASGGSPIISGDAGNGGSSGAAAGEAGAGG